MAPGIGLGDGKEGEEDEGKICCNSFHIYIVFIDNSPNGGRDYSTATFMIRVCSPHWMRSIRALPRGRRESCIEKNNTRNINNEIDKLHFI